MLMGAGMKAFVGVTAAPWYFYLSRRARRRPAVLDAVTLWLPHGGPGFAALKPGELFVFKTPVVRRRPAFSNRLVGAGRYTGFARLAVSEAWAWFGEANGAASFGDLRAAVGEARHEGLGPLDDPEIGGVLLHQVRFFDPVLPAPPDFPLNLGRGKVYTDPGRLDPGHAVRDAVDRYLDGAPSPALPRVGPAAFAALVHEVYGHRCAVTADPVRPALQAALIRPVAAGGDYRVDNGLGLRADIRLLCDQGLITVDPRCRLRVSPALRDRYPDGLGARDGERIRLPDHRRDRPARAALEWHSDVVFRSGVTPDRVLPGL
jgi:putative restriction endonuclease